MMSQQLYDTLVADRRGARLRAAEVSRLTRLARRATGAMVRTSAPAARRVGSPSAATLRPHQA